MTAYKTFMERELDRVLTALGISFRPPKSYFDLVPHGTVTRERSQELQSIEQAFDVEVDGMNMGTMFAGMMILFDDQAPLFRYHSGEINGTSLIYDILMSETARENLEFRDLSNKPRDLNILKRMKRRYAEETVTIHGPSGDGTGRGAYEQIVLYLPRGSVITVLPEDQGFGILDNPEYVKHFFDVIGQKSTMQGKRMLADKVRTLFEKIKTAETHAVR